MKDAQKPDHVGLNSLIERLKDGRFVIPDFQREFEWLPWDISQLMRSIFLDYYIGSLLLWRGKRENFEALACEQIYGYGGHERPELIVLDGQQRLTAIYYAFMAPDKRLPGRTNRFLYFIRVDRFVDGDYDEAFPYNWTNHAVQLLANPAAQYGNHTFPLAVVGKGGFALYDWVQGYREHWRAVAQEAEATGDQVGADAARHWDEAGKAFGEHIRGIVEQYQVAYIELDRDLELDKVCDIFTQINSRGIRLDIFDLINALLRPKGLQLKHLWQQAAEQLEFVQTERMNVYILQVMSILTQAYCSPKYLYYLLPGQQKAVRGADGSLHKDVLVHTIGEFENLWHSAVEALSQAIGLLRHPHEFGAISSQYLPYVSILPVFSALQVEARALPPERRLDAARKIRHWYWASVFTNRYSGSVESTAARDFLDVRNWFTDDAAEPAPIAEFKNHFGSLDLHREVKRGTSIYNGIFNLLVIGGARDWMTGYVPPYGDLDDHHIVPKDWRRSQPEIGTEIDSILNRTPLTADTNRRVIRDRLPNEYLRELIAANGEETVRATLETHFISHAAFDLLLRDPFTEMDFREFLDERRRTIFQAIEDLLIKDRLEMSPQLRNLDEQVERTELALRSLIARALDGDGAQLPQHVLQRVEERIRSATSRDPSLSTVRVASLPGKLEYSDLRELQDVITNKALWPVFASRFGNKETLVAKFDQLTELRNRLRHSRPLDDITRKEGEAALLWFGRALSP